MWPFGGESRGRSPYDLPLFPLKTVLFPGGLLPLKIFEQRYIEMAKACMRDAKPFGVCLITQGDEVAQVPGATPEIATVGTLARIGDFDMPQLGILHVIANGGSRFQVQQHAQQSSGLTIGEVVPIPDEPAVPLAPAYAPLVKLLELIATRIGPQNFPAEPRYDDASWVGFRLAEVLPLPLSIKQSMLEINDADVRLKVLQKFLAQQGLI
jgi:uncharacterized protein